jgi:subtilisin-like proprotein convertase family protein
LVPNTPRLGGLAALLLVLTSGLARAEQICSDNTLVPIPEGQISDTVFPIAPVPGDTVNDVRVLVWINHARISDLRIGLIHPFQVVSIIDRPGVRTDPPNGCTFSDGILAWFEEGAPRDQEDCFETGGLTNGPYRPWTSLSSFYGTSTTGEWTLTVRDEVVGVSGTLVGWCVEWSPTLFDDGFEGGDTAAWSSAVGAAP